MGAVRREQAPRGVDDRLEHLAGVPDGGDASRDALERLLRVEAARELVGLVADALEEALVRHGHRRVIGEGAQERHLGLAEVRDPRAVGTDGAERLALDQERRNCHRAHVRDRRDAIRDLRVPESLVAPVVARDDDLLRAHRVPEHAHPRLEHEAPDQVLRLGVSGCPRRGRSGAGRSARRGGRPSRRPRPGGARPRRHCVAAARRRDPGRRHGRPPKGRARGTASSPGRIRHRARRLGRSLGWAPRPTPPTSSGRPADRSNARHRCTACAGWTAASTPRDSWQRRAAAPGEPPHQQS